MNSFSYDTITALFQGDVELKANRIKRLWRIARRVPEVMVKVSGFSRSPSHISAHFEYISRNGKLDIEDEQGVQYQEKSDITQLAADWGMDARSSNRNSRHATHLVLSMPNGTEPNLLKKAVRSFAHQTFGHNYQYVMALHTDTDSPHVHLTIKNLGFDGRKLHIKKGQPQRWREQFAQELENLGIEAEATPRFVRGVIAKSISQAIFHLRQKGIVPMTDKLKVQQAIDATLKPNHRHQPWLPKIQQRQLHNRKNWQTVAQRLADSTSLYETQVAADISAFVYSMPAINTQQQKLEAKCTNKLSRAKDKELTH